MIVLSPSCCNSTVTSVRSGVPSGIPLSLGEITFPSGSHEAMRGRDLFEESGEPHQHGALGRLHFHVDLAGAACNDIHFAHGHRKAQRPVPFLRIPGLAHMDRTASIGASKGSVVLTQSVILFSSKWFNVIYGCLHRIETGIPDVAIFNSPCIDCRQVCGVDPARAKLRGGHG